MRPYERATRALRGVRLPPSALTALRNRIAAEIRQAEAAATHGIAAEFPGYFVFKERR